MKRRDFLAGVALALGIPFVPRKSKAATFTQTGPATISVSRSPGMEIYMEWPGTNMRLRHADGQRWDVLSGNEVIGHATGVTIKDQCCVHCDELRIDGGTAGFKNRNPSVSNLAVANGGIVHFTAPITRISVPLASIG